MNWDAMEKAIAAWVASKSGLPSGHVLWAPNNHGRPDGSYVTLQRGDLSPISARDEVQTIDHSNDDPPPAAGAEIEYQVTAFRSFGVTLQCFAPGAPRAAAAALSIVEALSMSLGLPSVLDALRAAGLSLYSRGSATYVPELVGTVFEGRALMELRFYVRDTVSEFGTFIGEVVADGEDPGGLAGTHVDTVLTT